MTCSSRSAATTSSSVARNAATSVCGSRSMNPTVSDTSSSRRSGRADPPHERVERHEQRVGGDGRLRPRQQVEQRRLARVGVADQRHRRHRRLLAPLAQLQPAPAHLLDLAARVADALADLAPVGLELRFARAARADAAAQARQPVAAADQPRQQVLQLRQLDLQLALAGPRPPREDVEDELGAIDRPSARGAIQIGAAAPASARCRRRRGRRRSRRTPCRARRACRCRGTWPASGRSRSCRTRSTTCAPAADARPASSSSERSASVRRTGR